MKRMQVKLINIVDKETEENSDFIPSNGLSYLIELGERKILFDAGESGKTLLHNMKLLEIAPNSLDLLILSHGHWDHSFGINALLKARTSREKLKLIAHPHAISKRKRRFPEDLIWLIKYRIYNFGFPRIGKSRKEQLVFELTTKPHEISPFLFTSGEISERKEIDSATKHIIRKEKNKYVEDSILDDLSLILNTKEGITIICGCGHAGILNICLRAKEIFPNKEIKSIIGGTHLVALNEDELNVVATKLETEYNKPHLYFSHCTGKKAIQYLTKRFGKEIVHPFKVGDVLTFEC
jgi:7,8-dihydropterin-6-yl-methyl-4-(beta-D-ribofuranosyl)aminobenzene 5'-phosphate synthase